jgi:hypothetical protein
MSAVSQMPLDFTAPKSRKVYFVTTRLTPDELQQAIARATCQDEIVLSLFRCHRRLTPSQCHALYVRATGKGTTPATSIRRAITVLTGERVLRKTDTQVPGPLGSPEHCWELAA